MDTMQKNGEEHDVSELTVICPECDTAQPVTNPAFEGKIIECKACATEFEIISLNPLKLASLEEEK